MRILRYVPRSLDDLEPRSVLPNARWQIPVRARARVSACGCTRSRRVRVGESHLSDRTLQRTESEYADCSSRFRSIFRRGQSASASLNALSFALAKAGSSTRARARARFDRAKNNNALSILSPRVNRIRARARARVRITLDARKKLSSARGVTLYSRMKEKHETRARAPARIRTRTRTRREDDGPGSSDRGRMGIEEPRVSIHQATVRPPRPTHAIQTYRQPSECIIFHGDTRAYHLDDGSPESG